MENVVDALKMAAAAMIFVIALSVAIVTYTKEKQAATAVLNKSDMVFYNTENIKVTEDRIVGIETIIPTLYSYFKEGYTILFYKGSYNEAEQTLDGPITPLTLYYSEALPYNLSQSKLLNNKDVSYTAVYNGENYSRAIYGMDTDDEYRRAEFWLNDELHAKEFIKSFINNLSGDSAPKYDMSRQTFSASPNKKENNKLTINFKTDVENGFFRALGGKSLAVATNARFIERTGIYQELSEAYRDEDDTLHTNYSIDSSVVEFSNNETVQNEEGTQKRVIQYILIGN